MAVASNDTSNETSLSDKFIEGNIAVSNWIDGVAQGLDIFLVGEKITQRRNETHLTLENSSFFKEHAEPQNSTSINADLRLPNLEEYWQIKFTSYDETQENRAEEKATHRRTPREQNVGATIGFFQKLGNVRTTFQPRIGLQDPLNVSHSLIFESVSERKGFNLNPKFEFFAKPDKGTGVFLATNFNFAIDRYFSLTFVNEGEYLEKRNLFSVTHGTSLGQLLSDNTSLSYNLFSKSINQPSYHLESYSISLGYQHVLLRNIFHYQLSTHLDFPKEQAFTGQPGATLNLIFRF